MAGQGEAREDMVTAQPDWACLSVQWGSRKLRADPAKFIVPPLYYLLLIVLVLRAAPSPLSDLLSRPFTHGAHSRNLTRRPPHVESRQEGCRMGGKDDRLTLGRGCRDSAAADGNGLQKKRDWIAYDSLQQEKSVKIDLNREEGRQQIH